GCKCPNIYIVSMSRSARKKLATESASMVKHCARQLLRNLPESVQDFVRKLLPAEFWAGGCQLVALNFQTPGVEMH
uniref:PI-PLC Y-box domain-containing protein n=1 Tax=Ditylenchus dipsaci TaxID=166011 RepID=A0A915DIP9_9BILA